MLRNRKIDKKSKNKLTSSNRAYQGSRPSRNKADAKSIKRREQRRQFFKLFQVKVLCPIACRAPNSISVINWWKREEGASIRWRGTHTLVHRQASYDWCTVRQINWSIPLGDGVHSVHVVIGPRASIFRSRYYCLTKVQLCCKLRKS